MNGNSDDLNLIIFLELRALMKGCQYVFETNH